MGKTMHDIVQENVELRNANRVFIATIDSLTRQNDKLRKENEQYNQDVENALELAEDRRKCIEYLEKDKDVLREKLADEQHHHKITLEALAFDVSCLDLESADESGEPDPHKKGLRLPFYPCDTVYVIQEVKTADKWDIFECLVFDVTIDIYTDITYTAFHTETKPNKIREDITFTEKDIEVDVFTDREKAEEEVRRRKAQSEPATSEQAKPLDEQKAESPKIRTREEIIAHLQISELKPTETLKDNGYIAALEWVLGEKI